MYLNLILKQPVECVHCHSAVRDLTACTRHQTHTLTVKQYKVLTAACGAHKHTQHHTSQDIITHHTQSTCTKNVFTAHLHCVTQQCTEHTCKSGHVVCTLHGWECCACECEWRVGGSTLSVTGARVSITDRSARLVSTTLLQWDRCIVGTSVSHTMIKLTLTVIPI